MPSATWRRSSASRTRRTWASWRRSPGSSTFCARRPTRTGALLVFDEVMTGFRVAPRRRPGARAGHAGPDGARQDHRRRPAGRGLRRPARAHGAGGPGRLGLPGRARCRATRWPWRPGSPRWGCSTPTPTATSTRRRGISPTVCAVAAGEAGVPVQVAMRPGCSPLFFSDAPVRDYAGAAACDLDAYAAFCRSLLDRGVYPPPSQFEAWFPSLAHGRAEVERTLAAAREALPRWRAMSALADVVRAADPALAAHAGSRTRGRRASTSGWTLPTGLRARGGPRGLPHALRGAAGLRGHGRGPAAAGGRRPLRARARPARRARATSRPWGSSPTSSPLSAQAEAAGRARAAEGLWAPAPSAVADARTGRARLGPR